MSIFDALKKTGADIVNDTKEGSKRGGANQVTKVMVRGTRTVFGDAYPEFLVKSPVGNTIEEVAVSSFILFLCNVAPDKVPYSEQVKAAADLSMQHTAARATEELGDTIRPMLMELASLGKQILENETPSQLTDSTPIENIKTETRHKASKS